MGRLRSTWRAEEVPLVGLPELVEPDVYKIADLDAVAAYAGDAVVWHGAQCPLQLVPSFLRHRDEQAEAALAEEADICPASAFSVDQRFDFDLFVFHSESPGHGHLGEGDDLPTSRDVVRRIYHSVTHETPHKICILPLSGEVGLWWHPGDPSVDHLQILRAGERGSPPLPDGDDDIPLPLEGRGGVTTHVLQDSYHAHDRRGVDTAGLRLVVEADVAAHDRGA